MESCEIKNCRLCNKEGFIFCDVHHEVIQKLTNFIPNMINLNDESLLNIDKVCTTCYQTVKTIVFNIENIMDTQKILRMEISMRPIVKKEEKHQIVEDITRKYANIKVKKISICSTNSPSTSSFEQKVQQKSPDKEAPPRKIVVVEALPDPKVDSPTKKNRALMCITCSQKFTDYDQMQIHLKSCKASPNNLKCFCGKVLNSKKDLALHVYSQHKQNKQNHVCTICHKLFSSLFNLQNHMSTHTSPNSKLKGTFMCHYCKGKFLSIEELKKHREIEKCGGKKLSEM